MGFWCWDLGDNPYPGGPGDQQDSGLSCPWTGNFLGIPNPSAREGRCRALLAHSHNDQSFLPTLNSGTAVGELPALLLYSPVKSAAHPTLGGMSVPSLVHLF